MKTLRYVPQDETTRTVTVAIQATGAHVTVTADGHSTTCPHEQRALDAHPKVKREARAPKRAAEKGSQS